MMYSTSVLVSHTKFVVYNAVLDNVVYGTVRLFCKNQTPNQPVECNGRFSSNFPHGIANTPGCYASSLKFMDPANKYSDLDLVFHQTSSIDHFPPVATTVKYMLPNPVKSVAT